MKGKFAWKRLITFRIHDLDWVFIGSGFLKKESKSKIDFSRVLYLLKNIISELTAKYWLASVMYSDVRKFSDLSTDDVFLINKSEIIRCEQSFNDEFEIIKNNESNPNALHCLKKVR